MADLHNTAAAEFTAAADAITVFIDALPPQHYSPHVRPGDQPVNDARHRLDAGAHALKHLARVWASGVNVDSIAHSLYAITDDPCDALTAYINTLDDHYGDAGDPVQALVAIDLMFGLWDGLA
jgi:hypothetical protein